MITDDFLKKCGAEISQPLKIVIKISSADGQPCVKISDALTNGRICDRHFQSHRSLSRGLHPGNKALLLRHGDTSIRFRG